MSKSLIIIGGGIAGLSAGCYAQMNGFNSTIYEKHAVTGGLCTAWHRKGFTFDLCIHWVVGSSPKSSMYSMWEELGAVQDKQFINYTYFTQGLDEEGNRFTTYADPDKLREHMLSFSPEDEPLITEITSDIRTMMDLEIPDPALMQLLGKYSMTSTELSMRFKNPVLRKLFQIASDWEGVSAGFILFTLSLMGSEKAGYPVGGSKPFAHSIEERYLELGGTISLGTAVEKILVENDTAVGVRLADGTEVQADIVLSAADGHSTIFDWLEGKYADDTIKNLYNTLKPFPPLVFVSLGVDSDFSNEPHWMTFALKRPFQIGRREIQRLTLFNHSMDGTLAPEGKTALSVAIETDYDYWEGLANDEDAYLGEKSRIKDAVINAIAELYPAILVAVEVVDVATPLTFMRYTGNWRGSYEGWQLTKETMGLSIPLVLPGLSNFYMAGQWVSPGGGLPVAGATGRAAVMLMCQHEKMPFVTKKPEQ
ncbi:MAG: phytoene desaturase family protein [Halobacteriota archaeon]